jgi:hypothetical protein
MSDYLIGGDPAEKVLNKLDPSNSSTAILTSSSVFTGDWVDVSQYSDVVVSVATDQNGAYSVQFSPDGTHCHT